MNNQIKVIHTENAPAAKGPYSQAMVCNGMVYVAGQLPLDPLTGQVVPGDFQAHAAQAIRNVEAVLKAAGSDLKHVVRINVYMTDVSQFPLFNEVYEKLMSEPYPSRTARVVQLGPFDVEVDAIGLIIDEDGGENGI